MLKYLLHLIKPYTARHDCRLFKLVLLADQVIDNACNRNEMSIYTLRFANVRSQVKEIWIIFTQFKSLNYSI